MRAILLMALDSSAHSGRAADGTDELDKPELTAPYCAASTTRNCKMAFDTPTGEQVRRARLKLGMTQVAFGKWLYKTERTVRNWECDTCPMDELAWEKVEMALKTVRTA